MLTIRSLAPPSTSRVPVWNIGAGAEFMLAPQSSAKAEYNFLDFGKDNLRGVFTGSGIAVDTQVHEFKVGVNYHFLPRTLFGRW